ncbi:MAG: DUF3330 domain-containing protein [Pseudomonadota bacterium]
MTDRKMKPEAPETIACDVCMKEIPKDLATSEEGVEYVYHFCGQECFDKWHRQKQGDNNKKNKP